MRRGMLTAVAMALAAGGCAGTPPVPEDGALVARCTPGYIKIGDACAPRATMQITTREQLDARGELLLARQPRNGG